MCQKIAWHCNIAVGLCGKAGSQWYQANLVNPEKRFDVTIVFSCTVLLQQRVYGDCGVGMFLWKEVIMILCDSYILIAFLYILVLNTRSPANVKNWPGGWWIPPVGPFSFAVHRGHVWHARTMLTFETHRLLISRNARSFPRCRSCEAGKQISWIPDRPETSCVDLTATWNASLLAVKRQQVQLTSQVPVVVYRCLQVGRC